MAVDGGEVDGWGVDMVGGRGYGPPAGGGGGGGGGKGGSVAAFLFLNMSSSHGGCEQEA